MYYSYMDRKGGEDFLFGSFLYRRAAEDPPKYKEAEKVFRDMYSTCGIQHWQELALFYLGNIYYKMDNITEAEKVYRIYLAKFPAGNWAQEVMISLAYLAENRGLYRLAIERYKNVLKEFPEDYLFKEIYMGIGRNHERLKNFKLAKEYYEKLEANYPGTIWARKARERIEEVEAAIKLSS